MRADELPPLFTIQVSAEAMAAPIISEEGRGLNRKKKKKPRVSEPGALVIEHAEASDAGQFCQTPFAFFLSVCFLKLKIL